MCYQKCLCTPLFCYKKKKDNLYFVSPLICCHEFEQQVKFISPVMCGTYDYGKRGKLDSLCTPICFYYNKEDTYFFCNPIYFYYKKWKTCFFCNPVISCYDEPSLKWSSFCMLFHDIRKDGKDCCFCPIWFENHGAIGPPSIGIPFICITSESWTIIPTLCVHTSLSCYDKCNCCSNSDPSCHIYSPLFNIDMQKKCVCSPIYCQCEQFNTHVVQGQSSDKRLNEYILEKKLRIQRRKRTISTYGYGDWSPAGPPLQRMSNKKIVKQCKKEILNNILLPDISKMILDAV